MPVLDLIDHSPQHPIPADPIPTASNLILIDNYDSFTWNVYQYLVLEGATVTVYRNDEISLAELIAQEPTQLVVSPGPGHPTTDSGISQEAILHFSGKIPVFGVCMGQQCIISCLGGAVEQTGEILHGKTSLLQHDGRGVYEGLEQHLPVTRYHSLAGTDVTLPECLEVSSWTPLGKPEAEAGAEVRVGVGVGVGNGERRVIMGVRHREFVVEGVQFHPESILTAEGRGMLRNFLHMRGGTWAENEKLQQEAKSGGINGVPHTNGEAANQPNGDVKKKSSILERIYEHRKIAVAEQKKIPSQRPADLQAAYGMDLAPPLIDFPSRLRQSPFKLSLLAEVKRASPSKGIISLSACAPSLARTYALAGASVISVLTEPEWFKGSIDDLRSVRQALNGMRDRPAVLRKEFVFDEYQILEARLAGADTVLLIVKMLSGEELKRLYEYSLSLGMEPLVEVNTVEEMEVAVKLGAKVIGVNNRNLTSFEVDMETTTRLMNLVSEDTILCALSGISGPQDVQPYQQAGVGAVLVGEALMKARDTGRFIVELLGGDERDVKETMGKKRKLLVKICGTRSAEAAKVAVEAGADLVSMILVKERSRCVSREAALEISRVVHGTARPSATKEDSLNTGVAKATDFFQHASSHALQHPSRALLVGVFLDQPLDYILEQQKLLNLDIVQLHGSEPIEWAQLIPCPVIKSFKPEDSGLASRGHHAIPLLDSGIGGTGQRLAAENVNGLLQRDEGLRIFLAGGLNPENVVDAVRGLGENSRQVVGVDVSSGVESEGRQDLRKIEGFVRTAKSIEV